MGEGGSNAEKRFIVPKEAIGSVRLNELQRVVDEVKAEYPEVLSVCVFGSSTKGRARKDSDIDGWMFVDSAIVAEKLECSQSDVLDVEVKDDDFGRRKSTFFKDKVEVGYGDLVRAKMKERLGLSDEQVEHIRALPVSEAIIEEYVEDWRIWDESVQKYQIDREAYMTALENRDYSLERPVLPDNPQLSVLPYMFHMAIGRGVEKYRAYLINKLEALGDGGDRVWRRVIERTEMMENHLNSGTGLSYPSTLAEAKNQYSSNPLPNPMI